jgi:hypothetical protein
MAGTILPSTGVQYKWALGEDAWNTGMDNNLLIIDSLMQCNIISAALTVPPVSPTIGDKYIPYTGSSGAWSALVGKLVVYTGSGWTSFTPKEGWIAYDNNTNDYLKYSGSSWVGVGTTKIFNTYADISASGTVPFLIVVAVDETNSNLRTTYFYDGATLNWVPMVGV